MNITGERHLPASQQAVWNALNDPEILQGCIPGCDEMERISDTEYRLGMLAVVGPVKARFTGKLRLSDMTAPERYSLVFEGSGGAAGFGKGTANVELKTLGESQTQLAYSADAQVGGKIAQVGSRLIDGIARKIAEEFFTRFETALKPPAPQAGAEPAPSAGPEPAAIAETAQTDGTNRKLGWLAGAAVVVIAIVVLALRHSS
jgi:carbon monoxide dehydrogenase subunit G